MRQGAPKNWFGYDTRSLPSALVMAGVDLLRPFRKARRFEWAGPCVISSLGGIGDLFIHLPLLSGLVKRCEALNLPVQVALMPGHAAIGRLCGWDVVEFDNQLVSFFKNRRAVALASVYEQIKLTRARKIALWIDLTGNAVNAAIFKSSSVASLAARVTRGGRSLTDYPLPHRVGDNEYEHCTVLAEYFGCELDFGIFDRLVGNAPPNRQIVLAISTACQWRNWPLSNFLQLVQAFPEEEFVIVGLKKELTEADRSVLEAIQSSPNVADRMDSLSLDSLISLIAHCKAIVSNDTGAAHIARAYQRLGAVIFGPTPLSFWAEGSLKLFHDTTCPHYPCVMWKCRTPENWCMEKVSAQPVITHLSSVLKEPRAE
jgi:ADP-heptose:LPS heptosyltransferase